MGALVERLENIKSVPIPVDGGVDEESASDSLLVEDAVKMTNWRLSKNGKRIQKRAGLQEEDTAFGEDVYGLATYYNSTPAFCKLAVLESEIQRKVGAGAWANIFDFTSNIDHTVKVHEIQDKQFIITEKGARVILPNGDVRQIGITAPTTIPTVVASYVSSDEIPLDDSMNYANQAAMDAVWVDGDTSGASTLDTAGPGVAGPDNDAKYMKFASGIGAFSLYAKRSRQLTKKITNIYGLEFSAYFLILGAYGAGGAHTIKVYSDGFYVELQFRSDGVWLLPTNGININVTDTLPVMKWSTWKILVDGSDQGDVKIWVYATYDGQTRGYGPFSCYNPDLTYYNHVSLTTTCSSVTDAYVWIDNIKISPTSSETAKLSGIYRYAITYFRGGNFGCESNPIKSIIGSVAFTGTGVNDMTIHAESEYTGPMTKTFRVRVKTAASPQDTIQWSEDSGTTWSAETMIGARIYLPYGIVLAFASITGHTATDYWVFTASAISAAAGKQQITLTSIPVSTDGQVTGRKIYRTASEGAKFFYLTTLYENISTTFLDNIPDMVLGDEMEEDRDLFSAASSTIGKFSEWWDNRLWIADHSENVIYYSAVREGGGVPEEFSLDERFVPVNKGDQDDVITAMVAYKDALYVFKRNDIFIIQKTAFGYAPYHLNADIGCIADNGVICVNDMLMFPSERGLEIYDGVRPFSPTFSVAINKTFLTADPTGYKYMSIAHDKEFNEVWFSIPSRLSGAAAITTVWNYIRNKFYYFQFYKVPSCLVSCKDSTGKRVLKMGTRDGFIDLCDYGTADHTTPITATYRKGWIDMWAHGIGRLLMTKYELPATKTITANVYLDMQSSVFRTAALTGVTPGATDIDLRKVVGDKAELGTRHRWLSVEYVNAEDCGGDCKINEAALFVVSKVIKNKTYAN